MRIFVNPSVRRRYSSSFFHRARFSKNESRASNRSAPQMHEMPSLRMPVLSPSIRTWAKLQSGSSARSLVS